MVATAPAAPPVKLNIDSRSPSMGTNKARVVMTIFSDFECTFCKTFARDVFPRLKEKYVDKGLLKVYFRFLPLDVHQHAFAAAEAAAYANEQGMFWQMHDFLFDNQQTLNVGLFSGWLAGKHLDTVKFKTHLHNHTYKSKIEGDIFEAHRVGISVTPAIVINGKITLGSRSFDHFSKLIDEELANIPAEVVAETCN
ncbi:DsbA family protein [Mucilaginibacter sp. AW1-3]